MARPCSRTAPASGPWREERGDRQTWSVDQGVIVGDWNRPNEPGTYLYTQREFDNFVLQAKFKLEHGNTGVMFRSQPGENYLLTGYQADMAYDDFRWAGVLYGQGMGGAIAKPSAEQTDRLKERIRQDEWNDYEIIADGDHLILKVNGITTVDTTNGSRSRGVIGLQLWEGRTRALFKDIRLRELNATGRTAEDVLVALPTRFTNPRLVGELSTTGTPINAYPWLSPDGLTIYWTSEGGRSPSAIYQAARPDPQTPFGNILKVCEGRLASVSADGLEIVGLTYVTGSGVGRLSSARNSTSEPFGTMQPISELAVITHPKGTAFATNDTSLFILDNQPKQPTTGLYRSARSDVDTKWSPPQEVTIRDLAPDMDRISHPSLTADGTHLLFSFADLKDPGEEWGAVADATDDPHVFVNPRPLLLDGQRFVTRGGRYCAATGELYFSKGTGPANAKYSRIEIWVADVEAPTTFPEWTELFDGRDLTGWRRYADGQPVDGGWRVDEGTLHLPQRAGAGDIMTAESYGDFELEFEWKVEEGSNSGVIYRARPGDEKAYFTGLEYQLLDDDHHPNGKRPITSSGALYAMAAPQAKTLKPVGEWNSSRIVASGDHLEHWLNGIKVVEVEIGGSDWNRAITQPPLKNWPEFGKLRTGHIVLQDHGDAVSFRNIRVRELSSTVSVARTADTQTLVLPTPTRVEEFDQSSGGFRVIHTNDNWWREVEDGSFVAEHFRGCVSNYPGGPVLNGEAMELTFSLQSQDQAEFRYVLKPNFGGDVLVCVANDGTIAVLDETQQPARRYSSEPGFDSPDSTPTLLIVPREDRLEVVIDGALPGDSVPLSAVPFPMRSGLRFLSHRAASVTFDRMRIFAVDQIPAFPVRRLNAASPSE